jgi:hypothetical protein
MVSSLARPRGGAGQDHAHLGGGKPAARVGKQMESRLRAGSTFRGHLVRVRMARRDRRRPGARIEAVDRDERYDDRQADGRLVHRLRNHSIGNSNKAPGNGSLLATGLYPEFPLWLPCSDEHLTSFQQSISGGNPPVLTNRRCKPVRDERVVLTGPLAFLDPFPSSPSLVWYTRLEVEDLTSLIG